MAELFSRVTHLTHASLFGASMPHHGDGIGDNTTGPQQ
jgi:hypothetical protein